MDVDLPAGPNRAVEIALRFVEDRNRNRWRADEVPDPAEYEFHREYGPDSWK